MGLNHQPELLRTRAADRTLEYLQEALAVSMAISPAIEYAETSRDILNSAGLRLETAAWQDAISRTTPAENLKFMHRKIALEQQRPA
ncbi:phage polarity suppression protein [Edwardsiella tarda]|uniref:phage polarity suppression protein n=1 Tax=Edwardsiella tarda TaxID=636 RepID=UPI00351C659F